MTYVRGTTPAQIDARYIDHELAGIEQELASPKFTAPALQNSWANFGDPYERIGFYKLRNRVYIEGVVKSGTTTAGTLLFTLPKTYRPAKQLQFPVVTNNGAYLAGRVDVLPDGTVVVQNVGATFLSLCGISFVARQ